MCSRVANKCIAQLITQFIEIPVLHSFKFCLNYIYFLNMNIYIILYNINMLTEFSVNCTVAV